MKKIVLVDMDGVIADLLPSWIKIYNNIWDDNIKVKDVKGWWFKDYVKTEAKNYVENILKFPNFYYNLNPIVDSQRVLRKMNDKYDLYILTDPYVRESIGQKIDWLDKHYPFINKNQIIFTGQKHLIKGDYMIEDNYDNLKEFEGEKILMDHPYNKYVSNEDNLTRVSGWGDIEGIFLR